jgi:uncharacterized membrane protein YphA (DoxX/SURF4 family)
MSQKIKSFAVVAGRIVLGLIYFIFGLNFFIQFIGMPPLSPGPAEKFMTGLFMSGYFFPVLKGIEVIAGLALILGLYVPLVLIVLVPVTLNIFLFHVFLTDDSLMSILMIALQLYLIWMYRDYYKPLLAQKALAH